MKKKETATKHEPITERDANGKVTELENYKGNWTLNGEKLEVSKEKTQ